VTDKNQVGQEILKVVEDNEWLNHPFFQFNDHEGYIRYNFGFRAGPSYDIFNVLHEVAHAIELPSNQIDRLRVDNYGLDYAESAMVYINCSSFCEPKTMQATERECRVFAIQKHITEALELPCISNFFEDNAGPLIDFMACGTHGGRTREERIQRRVDIMQAHYDAITMRDIKEKWNTAMEYIKSQIVK